MHPSKRGRWMCSAFSVLTKHVPCTASSLIPKKAYVTAGVTVSVAKSRPQTESCPVSLDTTTETIGAFCRNALRSALPYVCFALKSGHRQAVMSALPPKADMCSAASDVGYGPKADIPFRFKDNKFYFSGSADKASSRTSRTRNNLLALA
jgi:hypothetical protein